jgi:nucleoside-diphosphate-sugar epimerase
MRVVIIGGGGMLGQKLARALARRGQVGGRPVTAMTLADIADPAPVEAHFPVTTHQMDITGRAEVDEVLAGGADVIYHLAAVVSGQAEEEFDLGMAINLVGSINVFEAARALDTCPKVVFTSSIAVYGAHKAAAEMLLTDYSRKGFIDGRGLRLPTISIRPGKPNKAASGFMSSIFREPLQGLEAVCPVGPDYEHWYLSPRRCVQNLIHAAEISARSLGQNRCFALPGRTHSIGDMVEAMRRVAGDEAVDLIRWEPDPAIQQIVLGWKAHFNPAKALALGFVRDESFEDNIRFFLEDDVEA